MRHRVMKVMGLAACAALLATTGCARRTALEPAPGNTMPVAPYGANTVPEAEDLLERPTQAAPERSVELRTRSEARETDPFDLPPEG